MNVSTTGIYDTEDIICQHLLICFLKTLFPQQNACVRTFPENQHDNGTSTMNEDLFPIENGGFSSQSSYFFLGGGAPQIPKQFHSPCLDLCLLGDVFTEFGVYHGIHHHINTPLFGMFLIFFQAPKEANLRVDWLLTGWVNPKSWRWKTPKSWRWMMDGQQI